MVPRAFVAAVTGSSSQCREAEAETNPARRPQARWIHVRRLTGLGEGIILQRGRGAAAVVAARVLRGGTGTATTTTAVTTGMRLRMPLRVDSGMHMVRTTLNTGSKSALRGDQCGGVSVSSLHSRSRRHGRNTAVRGSHSAAVRADRHSTHSKTRSCTLLACTCRARHCRMTAVVSVLGSIAVRWSPVWRTVRVLILPRIR